MFEINVMDEGAAGDGTGDDQPAIEQAIDKAMKAGTRVMSWPAARVLLPAGTYMLKSPIVLPGGRIGTNHSGGNVHLIGHPGATVLTAHATAFPERRGLIEWQIGALLHESELARTDPDPQLLHRPRRYDIGLPSAVI